MASKFIEVRLNQQTLRAMYDGSRSLQKGGTPSKRERSDSASSASNEGSIVEYSYQDTFTTLLEKCLIALNIRGNDGSSTTPSNDDHGSSKSVTKQAIIYDKEHTLVTMLQEVKENETYFVEIIDSQIMAVNQLGSPMLPLSDSMSSDHDSFNNSNRRKSSLTSGRKSMAAGRQNSSFASGGAFNHGPFLSCDTDFIGDMTSLENFAQR